MVAETGRTPVRTGQPCPSSNASTGVPSAEVTRISPTVIRQLSYSSHSQGLDEMGRIQRLLLAASLLAVTAVFGYALVRGTAQPTTAQSTTAQPTTAQPTAPSPQRVALIMEMPSAIGPIVTDDDMFTLYRSDRDTAAPPTSRCTGACAATWRPVLVGGKVIFDGGDQSLVGTVVRPDGTRQLTLKGWPLYRYTGDRYEGDTNGEGVDGVWSAITPNGNRA
jgi:predicted lipoprotein with Yx(FWY)xxD motif